MKIMSYAYIDIIIVDNLRNEAHYMLWHFK